MIAPRMLREWLTTLAVFGLFVSMAVVAPAGPPSLVAASAPIALTLTLNDPFSVSPTTLPFGSYAVGSPATETVTLVNATGRQVVFQPFTANGISVTVATSGLGCRVLDPIFAPREFVLESTSTCDLFVSVDTSVAGPVRGELTVTDTNIFRAASATVTAEVLSPGPPANDNWANAQDLSSLAIPAFVGVPGPFPGTVQPRDTASVSSSTEFATYESGEFVSRPGGSLWYRYTAPLNGFAGRLGYRATPGFFVLPSTDNTSATNSSPANGNTWPPSGIRFVRMEPGHTVWFSVANEFVDPGSFTLELFQAPNEQDAIADAYSGTGSGEFALSADFNLFGDGDTYHLTADLPGGAPNGWFTLRFAVPGSLTVTYSSATAVTVDPSGTNQGSERPLGLQIYRSPQPTLMTDPTVLGAAIAVGSGSISSAPIPRLSGSRWETTATVAVTPGRYYWSFEQDAAGPTFFVTQWRFTASGQVDTEPPTATISTPSNGAQYSVGAVPSSAVVTCTDNQGATTSFVTVDGVQTTSLVATPGSHTVSVECTDAAGNTSSATSTYTVVSAGSGPCVMVDTPSVNFGDVAVGSTSGARQVVVRSCSDAPIRLTVSVSNATRIGSTQTWFASTSTVLADNQFTWSVMPPGGPAPISVGPTQTSVGPPLAAGASRTDDHRIALGPTGPGLGTSFAATFTYTAIAP